MLEAIPKRIRDGIEMGDEWECWPWIGARTSSGYGVVSVNGRPVRVHRYVYEKLNGGLGPGEELHHEGCKNKVCCNPAHLKVVTPTEHAWIHRVWERDRGKDGHRTHCPKGHDLAVVGVRINEKGHRKCRACELAKWRRKNERVRGKKRTHFRGTQPKGIEVDLGL